MKYDKEYLKENLYSGIISDVLDGMGYRNQMIGQRLFPLKDDTVIYQHCHYGVFHAGASIDCSVPGGGPAGRG